RRVLDRRRCPTRRTLRPRRHVARIVVPLRRRTLPHYRCRVARIMVPLRRWTLPRPRAARVRTRRRSHESQILMEGPLPARIAFAPRRVTIRSVIRSILTPIVVLAVRAIIWVPVKPPIAIASDEIIKTAHGTDSQNWAGDDRGRCDDWRQRWVCPQIRPVF